MSKKLVLISCLINVDGLTRSQANEHCSRIATSFSEENLSSFEDDTEFKTIILPVIGQPTDIKVIYPTNEDNKYFIDKILTTLDEIKDVVTNNMTINEFPDDVENLKNNEDVNG